VSISGGCLCGAVRFSAEPPVLFSAHCHCHWCRRAHGAAFVTWLGVQDATFAITSGKDVFRWYESSAESARGFCSTCGTTLLFRSKLAAGEMHIALACVDDAEQYPPKVHVFWEAHAKWNDAFDSLPRFDRDTPSLTKYQVIAERPRT
jgi:hypothetical protein